ncbi:YdeI/OmpD-associated family protein [Metabacillus sp. RGM 3146]
MSEWIVSAKRQETKEKRLEKMLRKLNEKQKGPY